ncbi:MAG TPA: hypothetical protein VFJ61_10425 [Solirubrobacterales bacterium]|nr:hypothetical protein [Solirubrobacterales bacterium]
MASAAEFLPEKLTLRALAEAAEGCRGCETNAVQHFKWRPRGNRRLHQTPHAGEIEACKPWLRAEVAAFVANLEAVGAAVGDTAR